jgi:hypothetical protein
MVQILARFFKRLTVFIPGIIIAYISYKYTLPFFDKRVPDSIAILATYVIAAYLLIPALIRAWRVLVPARHLPLYCITPDGFASDPLNVGIIGTRDEIVAAMKIAGWSQADDYTPKSALKHVAAIVFGWEYLNAPVSSLYLFGRKQDVAFQIPVNGTNVRRHHVRFWATTFEEGSKLSLRNIHWHNRRLRVSNDKLLWVGAASLDVGIIPIRHNMQITHSVHPDTNQERELILTQLKAAKILKKVTSVKLGDPYKLVNRTWRGELHTDGKMGVAYLKKNSLSKLIND